MTRTPPLRILEIPAGAVSPRRTTRTLMADAPKNLKLAEEAVLKIKEMIVSGKVRSSQKLPNEQQLSAEPGASERAVNSAAGGGSGGELLLVEQLEDQLHRGLERIERPHVDVKVGVQVARPP